MSEGQWTEAACFDLLYRESEYWHDCSDYFKMEGK